MRPGYLIAFFSVILLLSAPEGHSALKDFKEDYQKDENSKSTSSHSGGGSSHISGDSDECAGECLFKTFTVILPLWFAVNRNLIYAPYPYHYSDRNHFICNYDIPDNEKRGDSNNSDKKADIEIQNKRGMRSDSSSGIPASSKKGCFNGSSWYLAFEGGVQYASENGNAAFGRISGKLFRFLGPEIEVKRLKDKNDDHLDYFALGINIPVVQFSGFSPDLYIQRAMLRGIIERKGVSYGIIVNSYPVSPLSMMLRIGVQSYENINGKEFKNVELHDYEYRIGVILNRFEIFAAYRHVGSDSADIKGPLAGIKLFI